MKGTKEFQNLVSLCFSHPLEFCVGVGQVSSRQSLEHREVLGRNLHFAHKCQTPQECNVCLIGLSDVRQNT